ncbi:MAG: hypothetical protein AAF696_32870 [Bacteroidota bacterium]
MKKAAFLIMIFSCSFALGQESIRLSQGLTIKLQSRIVSGSVAEGFADDLNINRIRPLYPAITYQSENGHIHLVEVSKFDWDTFGLINATSNNLQISIAYEYALPLSSILSQSRWRPYLGLGINHFATRFWLTPKDQSIFSQRNFTYRSDLYLFPSIYKIINERLTFDIAFQIHIGSLEGFRIVNENPITSGPANFSEVRSTLFQKFGGRIGIGVKL